MPEKGQSPKLITVTGPVDPEAMKIVDAHNHVWIDAVAGAAPGAPVLNDQYGIAAELGDYSEAGGDAIIDCQPGGCGRDGRMLRKLAQASEVHIVACTGYHRRLYYPDGHWLFDAPVEEANSLFVCELTEALEETRDSEKPARAGFIKIACEDTVDKSPVNLMEATAAACLETGAAVEIHTEKGSDAERIVETLTGFGLAPDRIVLCHVDKRADFGLHRDLAQADVMLEYDTFYRPKYQPEKNVWPLLVQMVEAGLDDRVAIATDMAESEMWARMGEGPGLTGMFSHIIPRLESLELEPITIDKLVGGNIVARLAFR
jgi:predicted metal-dependent phosphotriesterase family hydrolase